MSNASPSAPNDNADGVTSKLKGLGGIRVLNSLIQRSGLGRMLSSFGGRRNYEEIFGWDITITPRAIMQMYNRGGIAKRVVDAKPDAIWARPPIIWAENDETWNTAWISFAKDTNLWPTLHKLDKLAGLGQYAILLIGTDKGDLATPLKKASAVTFWQPYGEQSVSIKRWNRDVTSPDFGRPELYTVYPEGNLEGSRTVASTNTGPTRTSFDVHASRVVHVAHGTLEDPVFGQPRMAPVWDYLTDLRKVVGSSSESYWIAANRGLQADVAKDMPLSAEDTAALSEEIEEFYNGFRRFIRTRGVQMKALDNDIADPKGAFDVILTLISGTSGIPKRILLGSEAGSLASTQDKGNWAERIEEEIGLMSQPFIVLPLLKKLIALGIIATPKADIQILWPDAYRMSPLERGQTAAQTARTLANITKMFESDSPEAKSLITVEEARAIVGLSSDNRVLATDPQV